MARLEEEARNQYGEKIRNIKQREEFNGGTVFGRDIEDNGNTYGKYAYLVSPPSHGREWFYLGKLETDNSTSQNTIQNKETDMQKDIESLEDLPSYLDKLETDYTGWTSEDGLAFYMENGEPKYQFEKNPIEFQQKEDISYKFVEHDNTDNVYSDKVIDIFEFVKNNPTIEDPENAEIPYNTEDVVTVANERKGEVNNTINAKETTVIITRIGESSRYDYETFYGQFYDLEDQEVVVKESGGVAFTKDSIKEKLKSDVSFNSDEFKRAGGVGTNYLSSFDD